MAASTATESGGPDQSIFHWVKERRLWFHLTAFMTCSFLLHGAGFYLFQVVYPAPSRVTPETDSIRVMDASDPSVRSVLQRVRDRTIFLQPASQDSGVRVTLDEGRIRFTPSFQRAEVDLLPPQYSWTTPAPLAAPEPELPPVEKAGAAGAPFTLGGGLSGRSVAPWSILADYLERIESLPAFRARIEVDEDGQATVLDVDSELDEADGAGLARVIESTLRFPPGEDRTTGWIEVGGDG